MKRTYLACAVCLFVCLFLFISLHLDSFLEDKLRCNDLKCFDHNFLNKAIKYCTFSYGKEKMYLNVTYLYGYKLFDRVC